MFQLTKTVAEGPYIKIMRALLSACFLAVPLLFFTDLTSNPFTVQSVLLYILLAAMYGVSAVRFLRAGHINFTRTFFDLAFVIYILAAAVSWLSAVSAAPQYLRQTLFYNLLDFGSLLLIVALGAYVISKNVVFSGVIESKTNYILLFIAWGALWLLLPQLKTNIAGDGFFARVFDWYGLVLWVVGIWLGTRVLSKLTQENVLVLSFVACALACMYGVFQGFGLDILWPFDMHQFASRAFSTFGNPNFLSSFVVMLLPALLVYYMRTESRKDICVYGFLVLVYLFYLSFGLCRSCWIAAAVGLVMMWMFGTLRSLIWQRKGRVFWLVVLGIAVTYLPVFMQTSREALVKRVAEVSQVTPASITLDISRDKIFTSLHQRLFMWDVSKEIFLNRPVMGAGLGNFQTAFARTQPQTLLMHPNLRELKTVTNSPHNEIFFQLAQGGIVGVGLFLFMFMVLFLEVRDFAARKKEGDKKQLLQALFCGILAMLADNMLNISLHTVVPAFIFWWIVGAEVSGVGRAETNIEVSANPVTKTVALAILALTISIVAWQSIVLSSQFYSFRGQKNMAAGQWTEAKKDLSGAQRLYPANTEAGFRLGNLLLSQENYEKALQTFEKSMAAAAYYDQVYYHASVAALGAKDNAKAVRYLRETLRLDPFNLSAYETLGKLVREDVIYADQDTMTILERGLDLFPYDTSLWHDVGDIYLKRGEKEYAKTIYKKALTIDTLDKSLLRSLSKLYDKTEEQPEVLAQAKQLQDYYDQVNHIQGSSKTKLKKLREQLEKYIEVYPQDTNGSILLARYFMLTGNDIKSKELLEQVLEKYPDDLSANLALASLLQQAEDTQSAKKYLQNVLFYYPQNQTATRRLERLEGK
ncbi:MAG: tetratricopeptide repeat protein [Elusimicrobiaceae bacterium]|nr:tetratricopeptide repeat protein [Elusimicrobiaceae bacterium]